MFLTPKNWHEFQHYKQRNPPWIKLQRSLLDNFEFAQLPVESRAIAPLLWLLASESIAGCFQAASEVLAFRLRLPQEEVERALKPLIEQGFFIAASDVLADRYQSATPEAETEGETEKRKDPSTGEINQPGTGTEGDDIPFEGEAS